MSTQELTAAEIQNTKPPSPIIAAICATCQGNCCQHGRDNHAYLTGETLQRWRDDNPGSDTDEVCEKYLSYIPPRHTENSCLYHTSIGCALPRKMRADICNRYLCNHARAASENMPQPSVPTATPEILIVAQENSIPQRANLTDMQNMHPVAVEILHPQN